MSLTKDNIIFSELATNFNKTLSSLRKSALTITNRLESIVDDSEFVCRVAEAYELPLVANERCGSWYIPLEKKVGSAYFKSTDGHTGNWGFSLRRLNLQLLDVLQKYDGCVIVDSTRRGKSMPDALSKTVPIWCSVMNKLLFPDEIEYHELFVPPQVVSNSEKSQIEDKLPGFVTQLKELQLDFEDLRNRIKKPFRPIWITRDSDLPEEPFRFSNCYTIVLCTSSRRVHGAEISEGGYIQGAGDDNESWSEGLTPPVFWKHRNLLLNTPEEELPLVIKQVVDVEDKQRNSNAFLLIEKAPVLHLGSLLDTKQLKLEENDVLISCGPESTSLIHPKNHLHLNCRGSKLGSRDLRQELPKISSFLTGKTILPNIFVACPDGKDLSVGICLVLLCLYFNEEGIFHHSQNVENLGTNKTFIKQRLSWITISIPEVKPSRATLQSVNDFVFSSQSSLNDSKQEMLTLEQIAGSWKFKRILSDVKNNMPESNVEGEAIFTKTSSNKYLLHEEGRMATGSTTLKVHRDWIWIIDSEKLTIRIYFSNPADSLYQEIMLREVQQSDDERILEGKGLHHCIDDIYKSSNRFFFLTDQNRPPLLSKFVITHFVKGPKKDYISDTTFERTI